MVHDRGMTAEIRTEHIDSVALLTVSDPARRNAFTIELATAMAHAVRACVEDEQVGALVITGEPPAFCAGAALSELGRSAQDGLRQIYAGFLAVADCPLPTVAAVNGAAVGAGLNLALACDVRLAGPQAKFDARFLRLGLHPGGGYTWMAHRVLGRQGAAVMTLFGEPLDAREAERVGLVWRQAEDVVEAAVELAGRATAAPRELAIEAKRTMRITAELAGQAEAVEVELRAQVNSLQTPEFSRRLAAAERTQRS
jgi:enoyl-CoA hydratase